MTRGHKKQACNELSVILSSSFLVIVYEWRLNSFPEFLCEITFQSTNIQLIDRSIRSNACFSCCCCCCSSGSVCVSGQSHSKSTQKVLYKLIYVPLLSSCMCNKICSLSQQSVQYNCTAKEFNKLYAIAIVCSCVAVQLSYEHFL